MSIAHGDVKQLFGDIRDHLIVEILASGATEAELLEAAAHLARETAVMGELERPLTGRARLVFDLLRRDQEQWEEER